MSSKPAFNEEIFKSHEAAFIEHYDWLRGWALQLTNHDRERAEDLVQEVFAQFAMAHTDLSAVQNIPAYLYTTLRNIHVSHVRLAGRSHNQLQSIVDYSGAEAALEATDPYTIFHIQDQLRRVCQYACLRKQSSRAGGVLILRYFHGYHLSEIAEVLRGSFQAVRQQLTFARNEARLFLENPQALKILQHSPLTSTTGTNGVCSADKLLLELRNAIFESCQGECISRETLNRLYSQDLIRAADNCTVAHIVSCPFCLDQVNARLGLPLLAERHPADTLGPNNNWRDGTRGPRDSGGSGSAVPSRRRGKTAAEKISGPLLMQCRRRATELFEHYPRELCVSVNGHVLGSQSVSSPVSRLRLDVTIAEELNFIEVLSEERARLLVMMIEPPPLGEPVQYRRLRLSQNRSLEVTFHYGHPWPMVEVTYDEPNFLGEFQPATPIASTAPLRAIEFSQAPVFKAKSIYKPRLSGLFSSLNFLRSFWLRPGFIAAAVSLVLIGILLTFWLGNNPSITAARLLERASTHESLPVGAHVALHRVIELEQRRRSDGAVIAKNRMDVWRDEERGLSVRRVYDQNGQLITGVWTEVKAANGRPLRRIYRRGSGQRIETGVQDVARTIRDSELWQLDPSAIVFSALLGHPDAAHVSETADAYVVAYDVAQTRNDGLLQAVLTLRKADLHPTAQLLVITDGRETYDYRFVEAVFEQPRLDLVNPGVFEPDVEFVTEVGAAAPRSAKHAVSLSSTAPSPAAVAELEVNVAYALDRFRTRFGDQLSLVKTPAGVLEVRGVVDSDETRKELAGELSRVGNEPSAIRIHLDTTAEVLARNTRQPGRVVVSDFAGSDRSIPLYSELSRYFLAHGDSGQTEQYRDELVREFAARVISTSQRAVAHSLELKQLGSRFSAAQLDQFTPSARTKYVRLVRNHAEALQRELSTLDGELQRILSSYESSKPEAARGDASSSTALLSELDRLHRLVVSVDQSVRASFAASSETVSNDGVKSARFRGALATALRLAEEIRQAVAEN